jgi:ketosteroid isomerase-like protein
VTVDDTNIELIRQGYAAFNSADIETLTLLFAPEATWSTPGSSGVAGTHVGRDSVFGQFGTYGGETQGSFKAALQQLFVGPDGRVIALHHNSGERGGRTLDTDCCIVFELVDGHIVSGTEHYSDLGNWDSFWV